MKFITELTEECNILSEDHGGKKYFYLEGIYLQSEVKNRNGRLYPRPVMEKAVARYMAEKVSNKTAYGELGHPQGPTINPERISHLIENLSWDGNNVIGRAKVLDTQYGLVAQKILEGGGRLGMSSRGLGSLKRKDDLMEVQDDLWFSTAADIVTDPSAPNAFVNGIMEDVDWWFDATSGTWAQRRIEKIHESVKKTHTVKQIEEAKEVWFTKFLEDLAKKL